MCLFLVWFFLPALFGQVPTEELNTLLMHSTFRIIGPAKVADRNSFGTVFFMGIPSSDDPKHGRLVLVTAAHVLDDIAGDTATLTMRQRIIDGSYTSFDYQFKIRDAGKNLYIKHADADVAAMYIEVPPDLPIKTFPPSFLADDERIEQLEIHPGDKILYLGFPLFGMTRGGFPFLREGTLASYPLTPVHSVKEWNFDGLLYGGNSGGPVYFHYENRYLQDRTHFGFDQGILGLVVQQINSSIPEFADKQLNYGVIVPAQFIKETLDNLTRSH